MKKQDVKAVLGRVLTWPAEAQTEAIGALRAIEHEWLDFDEGYHATREELAAIDGADRGELATDGEVEAAFGGFRSAKASNA
jgi:hypothetical protein